MTFRDLKTKDKLVVVSKKSGTLYLRINDDAYYRPLFLDLINMKTTVPDIDIEVEVVGSLNDLPLEEEILRNVMTKIGKAW